MDTIVEINESNIDKAAELSIELWPDSSLTEMTAHYEEVMNASSATCFLLQNKSGYFGFIELSIRNDYVEGAEELPVAYIEGLFVNERYRHNGSGTLLLKHAEDWARTKGFKQICSDTELENSPSIEFHNSSGFSEVSRIVCFVKELTE
jgi:aminoglycoside 6'-N-acetyltransferase I